MILYRENPKDNTRKLLELINEYSKVARYKINAQKFLAFLYTNNETAEREIKKTITFTITIKGIQTGKEKVQLSLLADDIILYIENPKDTIRKVLELINEYSKVAGYKINTQKSHAFLYTRNEKTEREMKETIPFTIVTQRIK